MNLKKVVSFAICLLFCCFNNLWAMSFAPLPNDINELVNQSDLIVVGRIGAIVDKRKFYGYQASASWLEEKDAETPFSLSVPIVDFEIQVKQIIRDDINFPHKHNYKFILRIIQNHDDLFTQKSIAERKGNMILFLTRNPDNKTYGFYSPMHRVRFDNLDQEIYFSYQNNSYKLPFAEKTKAMDFINEVKKYIVIKN